VVAICQGWDNRSMAIRMPKHPYKRASITLLVIFLVTYVPLALLFLLQPLQYGEGCMYDSFCRGFSMTHAGQLAWATNVWFVFFGWGFALVLAVLLIARLFSFFVGLFDRKQQ